MQKKNGNLHCPGPEPRKSSVVRAQSPKRGPPSSIGACVFCHAHVPRTYQVIVISEGQALLKIAWDGMGWGPVRGIGFASCDPLFFPYERLTACGAEG